MYNKNGFEALITKLDSKQAKRLNIPLIVRLITNLEDNSIVDEKIKQMLSDLYRMLSEIVNGDFMQKKSYNKSFRALTAFVRTTYKIVQKGTYVSTYLSVGIALGTAMFAWNAALVGSGIAIGLALGVAIGSSLENKAKKEGKLY